MAQTWLRDDIQEVDQRVQRNATEKVARKVRDRSKIRYRIRH